MLILNVKDIAKIWHFKCVEMRYLLAIFLIFSASSGLAHAKQHRSYHAIKEFKLSHPCPADGSYKGRCSNYVIDHVKPLACGGLDSSKNMQWQTKADARVKDRWERKGC